jgi:hypothetical protein
MQVNDDTAIQASVSATFFPIAATTAPKTGKLQTGSEFDGLETTAANGLRACREGKRNWERCGAF